MTKPFELKDSGTRQSFPSGSVRDTPEGKGRPSLIPTLVTARLGAVYEAGAKKYGDHNWRKGQPLSRFFDSAIRHTMAAMDGKEDEDHLFQAVWNLVGIAWTLEEVRAGRLPRELVDTEYLVEGTVVGGPKLECKPCAGPQPVKPGEFLPLNERALALVQRHPDARIFRMDGFTEIQHIPSGGGPFIAVFPTGSAVHFSD